MSINESMKKIILEVIQEDPEIMRPIVAEIVQQQINSIKEPEEIPAKDLNRHRPAYKWTTINTTLKPCEKAEFTFRDGRKVLLSLKLFDEFMERRKRERQPKKPKYKQVGKLRIPQE